MTNSALVWSPTIRFVREMIAEQKELRLIIAPFIKLDALKTIVSECEDTSQLQVVVRWNALDLVSGVSDVDIYPFLKEMRIPLFRHSGIHLKLLVYNQSLAFHTSGNITRRGMGIDTAGNVEVGIQVRLKDEDWRTLFLLLADSQEIDDEIYRQAKVYISQNPMPANTLPPMTLLSNTDKSFNVNDLPASDSPTLLYQFYSGAMGPQRSFEESPSCVHDLRTYDIADNLDEIMFFQTLSHNFTSHTFIVAIVDELRDKRRVRFGAMNAWITENCSNSPRPYRRDIKTTTRRLYNWLSHFYPEISWNQPNYSMVIYWND